MTLLSNAERAQIQPLSELTFTNPFLPERISLEKKILGRRYEPTRSAIWSFELDQLGQHNVEQIAERISMLVRSIRDRLAAGQRGDDQEYEWYDDVVCHWLYFHMSQAWRPISDSQKSRISATWPQFHDEFKYYFECADVAFPSRDLAEHVFAGIYQVHRAFNNIFQNIIGRSSVTARLRASIWQSIFTHDIRRYRRSLYRHMAQIATLIVGPSGTGKELVARAIGRSQYKPFDTRTKKFAGDDKDDFHSLHLAALPSTLVESELFGHAKDAFTGANRDRVGWLEAAGPHGVVFLDEVGEIEPPIQVKLLRVLQTRQFQRIGEIVSREFLGKLITATNRDLRTEVENGKFRSDLYFRLCGDVIKTASLQEQLSDAPGDLEQSIRFIAHQLAPDDVESIVADALAWIERNMPPRYSWPGNFRELEQCVRNVLVRNEYDFAPATRLAPHGPLANTEADMENLRLTADQLLRRYCTYAYWKTGNYELAAEHLKLDRRTVRSKIDEGLLSSLQKPMVHHPT